MKRKHSGGKHPPGYKGPGRVGKRIVAAYLERELFDAVHEITRRDGHTIQSTMERFWRTFVRTNGQVLAKLDQ
jgi:hypothetical protein